MPDKFTPVYDFLPCGREHAVSLRLIMQRFGLTNREARRQIERERAAGALILSTSRGNGGYWRPGPRDVGELEQFSASMTRRACRILRSAQTAAQAARDTREAIADFEDAGKNDARSEVTPK